MTQTIEPRSRVVRNDDADRYDIFLGDQLAGFTEFRRKPDNVLLFPHTEIDPEFGGRGLGGTLVGEARKDVAARGETVVPLCPFVVKYLRTHEVPGLTVVFRDGEA